MKDKAGIIVDEMTEFGVLPTDLGDDTIDNHIVYAGVSGDKLYHDIIKPINEHLNEQHGPNIKIHTSITGDKSHWDDCHANEKAYESSLKADVITKAGNKFAKDVSKICRGKKANDIRQSIGCNATYVRSPEERYTTHLSDQIDPLYEHYESTYEILNKVDWKKRHGFKTIHFVSHLCLSKDMLMTFNISLQVFQRCQNYRGYVELCDERQFDALNKYVAESKRFKKMMKKFNRTKDINVIKAFVESSDVFVTMHNHLIEIIENGTFKNIDLIFDVDLPTLKQQKWKLNNSSNSNSNENDYESGSDDENDALYSYGDEIRRRRDIDNSNSNDNSNIRVSNQRDNETDSEEDDISDTSETGDDDSSDSDEDDNMVISRLRRPRVSNYIDDSDSDSDGNNNEHQHQSMHPRPNIANHQQLRRVQAIFSFISQRYSLLIKFKKQLNKRRPRIGHKVSDEGLMAKYYFPALVDAICDAETSLNDIRLLGNEELVRMYRRDKTKNENMDTSILFQATEDAIKLQFISWKSCLY